MLISADRGPPGPPAISVRECQKLLAGPLLSHRGQQPAGQPVSVLPILPATNYQHRNEIFITIY